MEVTLKIKKTGNTKGIFPKIKKAMENSVGEIGEVMSQTAQTVYLENKKTDPKLPSMIIKSFNVEVPQSIGLSAKSIVIAGAPKAPWAIYVNEGHTLRNGTFWEGYHFWEAGIQEAEAQSVGIINKNFSNLK